MSNIIQLLKDITGNPKKGKTVYGEQGEKLKYNYNSDKTVLIVFCSDKTKGGFPIATNEENKTFKYI
jgi:hypothetical protein